MRSIAFMLAALGLAALAPMPSLAEAPRRAPGAAQVAPPPPSLADRIAAQFAAQAGPGARLGLYVATLEGREIVALLPDQRFVPGSNTKMFTTAAVYFSGLPLDIPDAPSGARVRLSKAKLPDVVLEGRGDTRLSSAGDCTVDCLAMLADAVAARTKRIGAVIGDDRWFPDERWGPGMSWNNMWTRSGTGLSALTIDDNEARALVKPGMPGAAAVIESDGYFTIDNRVVTGTATKLDFTRQPGGKILRVDGTIAAESKGETLALGIDDPAERAAWLLAKLLRERGVKVSGPMLARHRSALDPVPVDDPADPPLAALVPPPLAEDLMLTNKVSQNVHADLMLRRVGRIAGGGAIADGQAVIDAMLAKAGVERWRYDLADGSGMSSYNRITPRGTVTFLRWVASQPWGPAWRASLPVGGVDGTLKRRFVDTPLAGKLFAKTGTLNAANATSGYLIAASGQTLVFSALAADMPGDASATRAVDAALAMVAAEE